MLALLLETRKPDHRLTPAKAQAAYRCAVAYFSGCLAVSTSICRFLWRALGQVGLDRLYRRGPLIENPRVMVVYPGLRWMSAASSKCVVRPAMPLCLNLVEPPPVAGTQSWGVRQRRALLCSG
jgi:hypothetical protein